MGIWRSTGVLGLITGVLVALPSHAADARVEAAKNLVYAMRADEQAAQLAERYVRDACRNRTCKVDLTKCLAAIDRERILDRLVSLAKRELTVAEMDAGTAYFRSDVGRKHLEIMRATRNLGKGTLNDQKPEDRAAMLAFLDTSAGYRLVTRSLLTNSTEVNQMVGRERSEALWECDPAE